MKVVIQVEFSGRTGGRLILEGYPQACSAREWRRAVLEPRVSGIPGSGWGWEDTWARALLATALAAARAGVVDTLTLAGEGWRATVNLGEL